MSKWLGPRGEGYVVIQLILFALIAFVPGKFNPSSQWPFPLAEIAVILGFFLGGYGAIMISLGLLNLGRNLTAVPHPKEDAFLVQGGAYGLVRHPIYSGIIIGAFGWALFFNGEITLLLAVVLLLFFDWKTRREERMLAAKFPDYAAYQQRVRKLIPYIY